ncbi:hypothetical protein EJ02DRAFT_361351, partial [Clathrospora elynae]
LINDAMKDKADKLLQKLTSALHLLQVQNKLLYLENKGMCTVLATKKTQKKQSKPLNLQQRKEFHGGAVFWSPKKVREACTCKVVKQQQDKAEKLQKAEVRQLKELAILYKKMQVKEAKVEQKRFKEVRKKEREVQAAGAAATWAQNNKKKMLKMLQNLYSCTKEAHVVEAASGEMAALAAPELPPKVTTCGRSIRLPSKFR